MKKYLYYIIVLFISLDINISLIASDTLSLTQAIEITLDHSYS
ncbi:MAG: hypothetical protein RL348_1085, partial [Bacteroidota bacterium]